MTTCRAGPTAHSCGPTSPTSRPQRRSCLFDRVDHVVRSLFGEQLRIAVSRIMRNVLDAFLRRERLGTDAGV